MKRMTQLAVVRNIFLTFQNAWHKHLVSLLSAVCTWPAIYIVFLIIRLFHKDKNMAILECLAQLMVWLMETWTWGTEQREEGVWPIILDNETLDTSHAVTEWITYQCETQVKEKKPTAEQEVLMLLTARLLPWNQTTITQWQHPL